MNKTYRYYKTVNPEDKYNEVYFSTKETFIAFINTHPEWKESVVEIVKPDKERVLEWLNNNRAMCRFLISEKETNWTIYTTD